MYTALLEFGTSMNVVRMFKMFLNETHSKVCMDKHISAFSYVMV
jgi:hypothetical protein